MVEIKLAPGRMGRSHPPRALAEPAAIAVSEQQLQPELNQPGIRSWIAASHFAEVRAAERSVRRSELRSVKQVEELRAELQPQLFVRAKLGPFEYGEVKVFDSVSTLGGVGSRFIAERKVGGRAEAGSVKPLIELG